MTARPPKSWPADALPARLDRHAAAFFVGLTVHKFLRGVRAGRYPQPVHDGGEMLWITSTLRAAVDPSAQTGQPTSPEAWLRKLDDANDQDTRH